MVGLLVHLVVYLAVNAFLVVVWAFTSGSFDELSEVLRTPSDALAVHGFWPLWSIVAWGLGLAIHAGITLVRTPRRVRRRRARRREARMQLPAPAPAALVGRQRVTVVFTDIVGSTDLAESLGDDEYAAVLARHRRAVRVALGEHDGHEVGTQGDGFLVRFDRPTDAVAFAVDVQRRLEAERAGGAFTPPVRIGMHWGEATADEGDLVGRVLNLAARVTAAAGPGEILVTEPVADHLPTSGGLDDRGLVPLRGVPQPRHLLAVRWRDDEPVDEPAPVVLPISEGDAV